MIIFEPGWVWAMEPQPPIQECASMKERLKTTIRRRDLIGVAIAGAGTAAVSTLVPESAPAKAPDLKDKRKARYRADSQEVRNFYRVNSYPVR
jgi:hypothetical protein